MSINNPNTPSPLQTPSLTAVNSQTALRYALVLTGGWLVTHKVIQSDSLNDFVGYGMIVAPIAWAFLVNHWTALREQVNKVLAVQAGINSTGIQRVMTVNPADPAVKLATASILEQHAPVPVKPTK
jgi:hypothetical protein